MDIAQGVDNAGKALVVGSDGNISPGTISSDNELKLFTDDLSELITVSTTTITVLKSFWIEYITGDAVQQLTDWGFVHAMTINAKSNAQANIGYCARGHMQINTYGWTPYLDGFNINLSGSSISRLLTSDLPQFSAGSQSPQAYYRVWI